jgi:hypothetical protein
MSDSNPNIKSDLKEVPNHGSDTKFRPEGAFSDADNNNAQEAAERRANPQEDVFGPF